MKRLENLKQLLALEIAIGGSDQYIADLLLSVERAERVLKSSIFESISVPYPRVMRV